MSQNSPNLVTLLGGKLTRNKSKLRHKNLFYFLLKKKLTFHFMCALAIYNLIQTSLKFIKKIFSYFIRSFSVLN
jgi:hypothetical protein